MLTRKWLIPNESTSVVNAATVCVARVSRLSITALAEVEAWDVASGVKRSTCDEGGSKNENSEE